MPREHDVCTSKAFATSLSAAKPTFCQYPIYTRFPAAVNISLTIILDGPFKKKLHSILIAFFSSWTSFFAYQIKSHIHVCLLCDVTKQCDICRFPNGVRMGYRLNNSNTKTHVNIIFGCVSTKPHQTDILEKRNINQVWIAAGSFWIPNEFGNVDSICRQSATKLVEIDNFRTKIVSFAFDSGTEMAAYVKFEVSV